MPNRYFFTSRGAYVNCAIIAMLYTLIRLEISRRTRKECLKCVIVYLARVITALIESTDSMICCAQSMNLRCANHESVLCTGNLWIELPWRTRTSQLRKLAVNSVHVHLNCASWPLGWNAMRNPCTCMACINQLAS